MIIWLTGQSKAGKTTIARKLQETTDCVILDGDEMRDSISLGAGFSREDRKEHNLRVARLAKILESQKLVIVSVIAPMEEVRQEISEICNPTWIYIKRTIPAREGHFYEEPTGYFTLDHDKLGIEESANKLKEFLQLKKTYSLFIGRYQCLPPHAGHRGIIEKVMSEGKNVLIAFRDTKIDAKNPYSVEERMASWREVFSKEIESGQMKLIPIDDIEEVCYGRDVGWGIRQIKLDEATEAISATKIREQSKS
ncbi:MAG: adenylyl-sulfate kinase [Phenylobacterium sp.]